MESWNSSEECFRFTKCIDNCSLLNDSVKLDYRWFSYWSGQPILELFMAVLPKSLKDFHPLPVDVLLLIRRWWKNLMDFLAARKKISSIDSFRVFIFKYSSGQLNRKK